LFENGEIISWGLPFKGCLGRDLESEKIEFGDHNINQSFSLERQIDENIQEGDLE
jgi:hypothetical protein